MNFQIDHNLLHEVNNNITLQQWNELIEIVRNAPSTKTQPDDSLYICNTPFRNSTRYSCYDNYDRFYNPGLDFVISKDAETGTLTVYNGSEQARAPITFEQGKQIAEHFFSDHGSAFSEDIVCNWVMDGNPSIF